jgi:hypothetical protein
LRRLSVSDSAFTQTQKDELERALPNCIISYTTF